MGLFDCKIWPVSECVCERGRGLCGPGLDSGVDLCDVFRERAGEWIFEVKWGVESIL